MYYLHIYVRRKSYMYAQYVFCRLCFYSSVCLSASSEASYYGMYTVISFLCGAWI